MKRNILFIIALLLFSVLVAQAESFDDEGNPNDPNTNERANACYEGAEWEGKCDTEIEWIGGWYRIRLKAGIFAPEDIPAWLYWILDPEPVVEDEIVAPSVWTGIPSGCYFLGGVLGGYMKWPGGTGPTPQLDAYDDAACTIANGIWNPRVAARNQAEADALCGTIANTPYAVAQYPGVSIWRC